MIPDEHPDQGFYMTLRQVREILEAFGADSGTRIPTHEIDQAIASLKDGHPISLGGGVCIIQPEGAEGLYCGYLREDIARDE